MVVAYKFAFSIKLQQQFVINLNKRSFMVRTGLFTKAINGNYNPEVCDFHFIFQSTKVVVIFSLLDLHFPELSSPYLLTIIIISLIISNSAQRRELFACLFKMRCSFLIQSSKLT